MSSRISALLLLFPILMAGCISSDRTREEIIRERQLRFALWSGEETGKDTGRAVLRGPLSLDDAVKAALANNREIAFAFLEREKSRSRITEAWSDALPRLEADATYTHLDRPNSMTFNNNNIVIGARDNYALNATLSQPLFRGGHTVAAVNSARLGRMLAEEQIRGAWQDVIARTRRAYYDARLAIELEKASAQAVTVSQRLLEDTRRAYSAGTQSSFDFLRAQVELKSMLAEQVQAQNRVRLAITSLLNVMTVSQESKVDLTTELTCIPTNPSLPDAVKAAFTSQTDILQAELVERMQKQGINSARAGFFPSLDAFFTKTYARPDPRNQVHIAWNEAWSTGLSLKYPIFEGFKTLAQYRHAKYDYNQSRLRLRDAEDRVLVAVKQALFSLEDAVRSVAAQEAAVEQAQEAQRLAELGYKEGVRKQVEVLDAQRALTRAQAQLANAYYAHEIARLEYEQSTGRLGEPNLPVVTANGSAISPQEAAPGPQEHRP